MDRAAPYPHPLPHPTTGAPPLPIRRATVTHPIPPCDPTDAPPTRPRDPAPHFPTFSVATPRRHYELRRIGPPATPRPIFRVTFRPLSPKRPPADRRRLASGLPSETVGEGDLPFLISSLDGEKLFAGRASCPTRRPPVSLHGHGPVDLSPSDQTPRAFRRGY